MRQKWQKTRRCVWLTELDGACVRTGPSLAGLPSDKPLPEMRELHSRVEGAFGRRVRGQLPLIVMFVLYFLVLVAVGILARSWNRSKQGLRSLDDGVGTQRDLEGPPPPIGKFHDHIYFKALLVLVSNVRL